MRILCIRGRNLASLDGDFEVDLAADPLDRAGVFAITGRTGAGKSTLLDALCVALFDRTPRLSERGGPAVGTPDDESQRLPANDVRTLLRRGRGEGFAEVDFLGRDRRRYRARWQVRRARNRPQGNFQLQQLSLTDLETEQRIGRTKTEVLEAIELRLGLSFEQFRRSVLLAQGEFAAFLQAGGDERAALLERITGLGIYSEISKAAFRRAKEEKEAIERLKAELAFVSPLDAEARASLEADRDAARAALKAAEARQADAEAARAWHRTRGQLEAEVGQAEEALAEAASRSEAAADLRREAAAVDAAQPLRRPHDALAAARAEREAAGARREEAARALEGAEGALSAAREARLSADAALEARRAELEAARPQLAEARRLDERLEAQRAAAQAAQEAAAKAGRQSEEAGEAHRAALGRLRAAEAEVEAAEAALAGRADAEALEPEWARWDEILVRLARGVRDRAAAETEAAGARADAQTAEAELDARTRAHGEAEARLREASAAVDAAEAAAREAPAAGLSARARTLDQIRQRLETLSGVRGRLVDAADRRRAEEEEIGTLEAQRAEAAQAVAEATAAIPEATTRVVERREALSRAQAAQGLESRRAELVAGEPCPLCGSPDHPWAERSPGLDALVRDAADRAKEAEQALAELDRRSTANATRRDALEASLAQAGGRLADLERAAAGELEAWRGGLAALEEVTAAAVEGNTSEPDPSPVWPALAALRGAEPWPEETEAGLAAALREVQAEAEAIEARQAEAARRDQALTEARREAEAARGALDAALRALHAAREAAQAAQGRRAQAEADETRAGGSVEEALAALAPVLAELGGREAAAADPDGVRREAGARVEARRAAGVRLAAAREALAPLRPAASQAEERLALHTAAASERRGEAEAAARALEETRARRAGLLDGRPADEAEQALQGRVDAAGRDVEEARGRLERAATAQASAEAALAGARSRAEEAEARVDQASAAFQAALAESGFEAETLDRLLVRDETWRRETRARLQALDDAVRSATERVEDRKGRLQAHLDGGAPALDAEAAEAERAAAGEARAAAHKSLVGHEAELERDDRNRAESARLGDRLEQQAARHTLWAQVAEVIGSADGKKLRLFAQSLTLEVLVEQANAHLDEISGRYRLMKIPDTDFDLQVVDRHMGDDIRSVKSLSGGESFMVSLALALGLSALAAADVRVESLFVDEGFGTLDAQTLETVLGTLDALQATGRQVAIISHVADIAERMTAQVAVESLGAGRSRVAVRPAA